MILRLLQLLLRRTLSSVVFGIAIMVLIAAYVAAGSGFPSLRAHFEMTDLEFFNAWPLKVLMVLLVANLGVVTWQRIPFTPPRYGVWTIHTGIVLLILGMAYHYRLKTEGMVRIGLGQTVSDYYDGTARALYARIDPIHLDPVPLPGLPRFHAYAAEFGNEGSLRRAEGLDDIQPSIRVRDARTREVKTQSLREALQLAHDVRVDIVGYYPYAEVRSDFVEDPSASASGVKVSTNDPHSGAPVEAWLVASDPAHAWSMLESAEVEHRAVPEAETIEILKDAASRLHRIEAQVADHAETLYVQVGQSYSLGATGYTIAIESFNPAWPMFGTGEIVKALTLKVRTPTQEFRRMILHGKSLQTDFKLDGREPAGPMGARQKEPLDRALQLLYTFDDPQQLAPRQGSARHVLVTAPGGGMTHLAIPLASAPRIEDFPSGTGTIEVQTETAGPFAGAAHSAGDGHDHSSVKLTLTRSDHVAKIESVEIVPPAKRDRDLAAAGVFQVVRARVSVGDWSREVLIPFAQDAAEVPWDHGMIAIPGIRDPLRLQLGNLKRPLPARITLNRFDLVPYAGGDKSARSLFRDFRSTITVEDPQTGERGVAVAHMNNPVYFDSGRWLFFQAQWDPNGQRWTVLGVGNRPGVWVMTAGCMMMGIGLLYAFYVKPIIIRRMKARALADANGRRDAAAPADAPRKRKKTHALVEA